MRRTDEVSMSSFEVERDASGVAIITFDAPGEQVNTLSTEIGREFGELLSTLSDDPNVKAVVLISGKPDTFIAGAKLEMLQQVQTAEEAERLSRAGQLSFAQLEASRLPVVAAIHGSCLGGGLEWALACSYRIATDHPKTQLGTPEVMLGLLPGAGGTQRLPRLVGLQAGLDMILTGKQLRAGKALKLGLVDEVVPAPLLRQIAAQRAAELGAGKKTRRPPLGLRRLKGEKPIGMVKKLLDARLWTETALEQNPVGRNLLFRKAREQVEKKSAGHYPAPLKALEAVRIGVEEGFERGQEAEARFFGELAVSEVSRQLVNLFFAQTALKKDPGVAQKDVKPREVRKLGVLGGGLMGSGIAYVSMQAGWPVRLKDRDPPSVGRGMSAVHDLYQQRVKRRSMTRLERNAKMSLLSGTTDLTGFKSVDLVIEAVFEDLELKQRVLREIEQVCPPETIFASNTSSIPISRIAEAAQRPENVIGMHYFSPVNKMPLLEIIATRKTSPQTTATAVAVGKKQGKTVIVVNDGPGFYTSRILAPYMNEAAQLLLEGASVLELDRALTEFGFPVGPMTLLDEVGLDVGSKVAHVLQEELGDRMAAPQALDSLVRDGRLGRKAKRGFYLYDQQTGDKLKEVDQTAYDLLPGGRTRKNFVRAELAERLVLAMVNEAIRCLGEGILRSARDGDIGAVFGLGFPPFLGGPFRFVDRQGAPAVLGKLELLRVRHGSRFTPAPLLVEVAGADRKFYPEG